MLSSQVDDHSAARHSILTREAVRVSGNKWFSCIDLGTGAELFVNASARRARWCAHTSVLRETPASPIAHIGHLAISGASARCGAGGTAKGIAMNREKQAGQAVVLVAAVLLLILLPIMGLGIDFGYFRYQEVQLQTAADAAAIAAAGELSYGVTCSCNAVQAAGQNASAANGFASGAGGATVTVNNPPQSSQDPNSGNANYVEVVITQNEPTFFARILGINSVALAARAEAMQSSKRGNGVLVE
jgi:hypothetical protein